MKIHRTHCREIFPPSLRLARRDDILYRDRRDTATIFRNRRPLPCHGRAKECVLTHLETPNTYAGREYKLLELRIVREGRDKKSPACTTSDIPLINKAARPTRDKMKYNVKKSRRTILEKTIILLISANRNKNQIVSRRELFERKR